jgi:hypothetical protein
MIDNTSTENQKNMQEYSDHYLFTGENKPAGGDDHLERIGEIQDHPLYNLVDDKNKTENEENDDNSSQENFFDKINKYNSSFLRMDIPHRKQILSHWFRAGSLGYIFGMRGSGKTWFAWKMAICISKGEDFGPWKCESPWKILYVDGEMPLGAMQERLKFLDQNPGDNLFILSREDLMDEEMELLNLCDPCYQEVLLDYCLKEKIKVIFLDNLSSLCWGMKENEADSWEQVLDWLLMLRQSGIAVVIVHHPIGTGTRCGERREGRIPPIG